MTIDLVDLGEVSAEVGLVPALDAALRQHGLPQALAIANGPGSFTGLRVSVMAVRTLAWVEDLPVHAVDSLVALACEQGPGCWWCLLPLKRDTTFHAVIQVHGDGRPEVIVASAPILDTQPPELPAGFDPIAIGPALTVKPHLVQAWRPQTPLGSSAFPTARGVALAAKWVEAKPWADILPAYLQDPAPMLQRQVPA